MTLNSKPAMSSSERHVHKAHRADKRERLKQLRLKASSMLVQIRRDLGGGYVEDLAELNIERAEASLADLKEIAGEHAELKEQIEELTRLIGD